MKADDVCRLCPCPVCGKLGDERRDDQRLARWHASHMTAAYLSSLARAFSIFFPGNVLNRAAANADLLCAGRGIIAGVYSLTK